MTKMRNVLISAVALLAASPALASAPTPLGASGGQGGSLGESSDTAQDGAKFDCYAIDTKAGEEVELKVKSDAFAPEIWVARGASCDSMAVQAQSEAGAGGEASVKFKAAGGRYLIMTRATGAKQAGTYRIVVMHAADFKATAADSGSSAEAGSPADAGTPTEAGTPADAGDRRVAVMKKQVAVRQMQLAEEARIAAAAERERQHQMALAEQRRRQAEAEAQQSDEGGVFGRALGGFLMGAMLGGGGEGSMDMAIAGAQAAAQGGNALEVINSIGSAVPSNTSGAAMGGSIASASSGPVMPNTIGGSCSGMDESNYRQVAVASGGDTQKNTMCGLAYEHYNIYKNSVAQGYSSADQQLAYDAYQKSVAALDQFSSETSGGGGIHQDTRGYQAPPQSQEPYAPNTPATECHSDGHSSCVSPQ